MKMTIGAPLPDDYDVKHADLADAATTLIAHALLPIFAESLSEDAAKANVQGIVTELAYLFDEGEIVLGGKTYRPRIAFVDESGAVLPGVAELTELHTMTDDLYEIDELADIRFEQAEFDDDA